MSETSSSTTCSTVKPNTGKPSAGEASTETMHDEVVRGLQASQKRLSSKYFYDERGSRLFDRICELPEYYLTRTELAIMRQNIDEVVNLLGSRCMLIEYGSGSSVKTQLLLDRIKAPAAYVPIDISGKHLEFTASQLRSRYPDLEVLPVIADFTAPFELPEPGRTASRRIVYFPGSTIGNFSDLGAKDLLRGVVKLCGEGGGLVIGVDLKKDRRILEAAYDDSQGVTKDFNMNLLRRINRELDADFQIDQFGHHAFYNESKGRMESHLVSRQDQTVSVGNVEFEFDEAETIHTESSYKYDLEQFRELSASAGLELRQVWTDNAHLFSVQYLTVS